MGKTATGPEHTLFAFGTPFREIDGGGRAEGNTALPQIGKLAIVDASAFANGFQLLNAAKYGATMETLMGEIYVIEIMPKHPQSNTPYDRTTAVADGDYLWVHQLLPGDVLWLPIVSETIVTGQHLITDTGGTLTTIGVGGVPSYGHYWVALQDVASAATAYGKVMYMGVAGIDTTA
jgi:hypothetical protein